MSTYIAIAKRSYVPVSAADDEVFPGNIAALEKGLEARKAERSQDLARAAALWAEAQSILVQESNNETGDGAQNSVEVDDTFLMAGLCCDGWAWPGYGG